MEEKFTIKAERRNNDVYIAIAGDFDGASAWKLVNAINDNYSGDGIVYINTSKTGKILPFALSVFKGQLPYLSVPENALFFDEERAGRLFWMASQARPAKKTGICGRASGRGSNLSNELELSYETSQWA